MEKSKREILALGLLILMGICVASAMAWYIMVGHNWNKAASHIDDFVGSMDDYLVVVYEGTLPATSKGSAGNDTAESEHEPVSLGDMVQSYREKGAAVITLHLDDLGRYTEPIIVSRNGIRVGICACPGKYRYVTVRDAVAEITRHDVDFTVVLADHTDIKKGWLRHVDAVVLACDGRIDDGGAYYSSAFFVDAAQKGQVRAIIVSPSGTITAKTTASL